MARAITKKIEPLELKHMAEELEVNRPIMAYRVVGDRVELHLMGGSKAIFQDDEDRGPRELELFLDMIGRKKVGQLRKAAGIVGIENPSKLRKDDLIAALSNAALNDPESVLAALQSV